jgi:Protein of unknown function (DUF1593)
VEENVGCPGVVRALIRAYGKVYDNLVKHDSNYPRPEVLEALVKQGRAEYGMSGVGRARTWIIRTLEQNDLKTEPRTTPRRRNRIVLMSESTGP